MLASMILTDREDIHMTAIAMTPEQRRKNVRIAWLLGAFALFMMLSSFPFWKGMFNMMMQSGL